MYTPSSVPLAPRKAPARKGSSRAPSGSWFAKNASVRWPAPALTIAVLTVSSPVPSRSMAKFLDHGDAQLLMFT